MSKSGINAVIQRATSDAAFRRQLQRDPKAALAGFDLTADERSAVTSGDPTKLSALGVDQRMSKAFNLGAEVGASYTIVGDPTSGASAGITDEVSQTASGALVSDDTAGAATTYSGDDIAGPGYGANASATDTAAPTHLQMVEQDLNSPDLSVVSDDTASAATTYSGDDIAGPGYGANASATDTAAPTHVQMVEADLNSPDLSAATSAFDDAPSGDAAFDPGFVSGDTDAAISVDDGASDVTPAFDSGTTDTSGDAQLTE